MTAPAIPPLLRLSSSTPRPGVVVVEANGEIDAATAPQLTTALEPVWASAPGRVVLDLSRVTFLGTAGLGALLRAADHADTAEVVLRLVGGTRCVDRAVEVAGLGARLPVSPDLGHALHG
ncbi:anti-anti-sigma factor [Amycolatopsis sacchari]|uniref:Anti-sigma factor antagonist n=1 Tax=Amycolatopsis sacchari TaxID=115433 RepID=A0A1I3MLW6_9PSEU|nr:STAS domain-containing protein [Amycolatopsis sacchari]SFI97800.1 anti-anti-sigma factor [Amycolatopsis sacchari]